MKKILILSLTTCLLMATKAVAQVSFGEPTLFNNDWLFILADDSLMSGTDYDDSQWRHLSLPHDWSIEGTPSPSLASCTGYLPAGIGWYRKHFTLDDPLPLHYIYFEGVYNRSSVYLNGHLLGFRPNGYISFLYDMTPYLKEGDNVLAVRVDHSRIADSRWYSGSGIYRNVWIVAAPEVHIAQWGVGWHATKISSSEAIISVDVEVENYQSAKESLKVVATLTDAQGRQVGKNSSTINSKGNAKTNIKVTKPKRWSTDDPYLYTLKTDLYLANKRIDGSSTKVGLRTLEFDANKGFALNGEWTKVKGVCLHHDAGVLGAAVPREVWHRRLARLKTLGVNAIRMSHNPQAPAVYDLCDELGLLVMDEASDEWEFPKRKWIEGWNIGTPGYEGSFDFFDEWIERDVADMVRRDRNHPCIFLWSIGNEVDYPNDPYSHPILDSVAINQPMFGGYDPNAPDVMRVGKIAKRLASCVRSIDASRPVTGALAGVVMTNQTEYPDAIDVVGYNYTEDRYDQDHKTYPHRVIYGSENGHSVDAWHKVRDNDFIFGQFLWTGIDYLGESGRWPSRGKGTGLLDFGAFPKLAGWLRSSLWNTSPTTYIATTLPQSRMFLHAFDTWNYDDGQTIRVLCLTNAPQARLLLNGNEVGPLTAYDPHTGFISWDVPFLAGELTAEGCDENGNVLSSYSIKTSLRPYALRATSDVDTLTKEQSLAHITLEVVDENGVVVHLADNMITCIVEGPARLLGLENSDNSDMSYKHTSPHQRVYQGRLLAYIQATESDEPSQEVKVKFSSPLLQGTEITLKSAH